jgi:hypothetical protein
MELTVACCGKNGLQPPVASVRQLKAVALGMLSLPGALWCGRHLGVVLAPHTRKNDDLGPFLGLPLASRVATHNA